MLTQANFDANLRTAARNAAAATGLDPAKRTEWTTEQRQSFNRLLIAEILKYPQSFSPETVNQAATMNTDYGLRRHAFDSALDIAGDAVAPVAGAFQDVGKGAIAALSAAKWLIPVALIALVVIWLLNQRRPPAAPA